MKKSENKASVKWKTIISRSLVILCAAALGVNLYLTNAQVLTGNQLPMPFGYGSAVVLSGSMEPTFSTGDLIVVEECEEIAVDDIVVYQQGSSLVVHRVIAIDGESVITQGDANNVADAPVQRSAVKGRVMFWIPGLGDVVTVIKSPAGTIALLAAAIALVEIPHLQEKKKDEQEREKLMEEIKRLKDEV